MQREMAVSTKCHAIGYFIAQFRVACILTNVMRSESTLMFLALTLTVLAHIAVAFQHGIAPGYIARVFESLPGLAALPLIMFFTFWNRATRKLRLQRFGFGSSRHPAASGFCCYFGARCFRNDVTERLLAPESRNVLAVFLEAQPRGARRYSNRRDAEPIRQRLVTGRRI